MTAFTVYGQARPKGNMRRTPAGGMYDSDKGVKAWMQSIAWSAHALGDARGTPWHDDRVPLKLEVVFWIRRPAFHLTGGVTGGGLRPSAPGWPTMRPDVDKLVRAVLDALTGVAYSDDSQVVQLVAQKRYCAPGESERTIIAVSPMVPGVADATWTPAEPPIGGDAVVTFTDEEEAL